MGLYDSRERVYSPTLGRWLQTDPIGLQAGDLDLYRYVADAPLDLTDSMGLDPAPSSGSKYPYPLTGPLAGNYLSWFYNPGTFDPTQVMQKGFSLTAPWAAWSPTLTEQQYQFKRGCIGLVSLRTGAYQRGADPQNDPNARIFKDLDDALTYWKQLNSQLDKQMKSGVNVVLFAIQTNNKDIVVQYTGDSGQYVDPKSISNSALYPFNFATGFVNTNGSVDFWEWTGDRGARQWNQIPIVHAKTLPGYTTVGYGIVQTDSNCAAPVHDLKQRTWKLR
jgi:uncharacterized protein RhaS with RHS repeats